MNFLYILSTRGYLSFFIGNVAPCGALELVDWVHQISSSFHDTWLVLEHWIARNLIISVLFIRIFSLYAANLAVPLT